MTSRRGRRGNCYVLCEALYHLMGGKTSGWKPCTVRHEGDVHWFLMRDNAVAAPITGTRSISTAPRVEDLALSDIVLDPTVKQFNTPPPYHLGRGCGFLTKQPSKRAKALMEKMLWQETSPSGATTGGARPTGRSSARRGTSRAS